MRFDLDKKGKITIMMIMLSFLGVMGYLLGRGDWRVVYNPMMIFFYLLFAIKAVVNKEYYVVEDNVLFITKRKKCIEINILDIKEINVIYNYIVGGIPRGGYSVSKYIIYKDGKIGVSTWYKNKDGENIIEYLEKRYDIAVNDEVNISTKRK